jgi:hypothetical protein
MQTVIAGVKKLLKPDGFLSFEVHYLKVLLEEMQYDMMYHDHMSYYSLISLQNVFDAFGMEVFDVKPIPIHAGSRRFYVQHKKTGGRKITAEVKKMREEELAAGLDRYETYRSFYQAIDTTRRDLNALLARLKKERQTVIGYGASGRATQLMSFCGIGREQLAYVVDDAPAKLGAYTPGNHLEIKSSAVLDEPDKRPDYVLLFAWSFLKEIAKKQEAYLKAGGKFIVPLPEVTVIDWESYQQTYA